MGLFSWVLKQLDFDRHRSEFELLERETGAPSTLNSWQDVGPDSSKAKKGDASAAIGPSLQENIEKIKTAFRTDINPDIVMRQFTLCGELSALAVFVTGMANSRSINDFIIREGMHATLGENRGGDDMIAYLMKNVFTMNEIAPAQAWQEIKSAILEGRTAVFVDGQASALLMDTRGYEKRGVDVARNEKVVKGPQEAFTESLRTNITLVRRIIRTEDLVCEFRPAGGANNLMIGIMYREGIANVTLVEEVKRRLALIDTKTTICSGTLQQLTTKRTFSPVPMVLSTERPDRAASFLMKGHVAVIMDGCPFAEIMPITLSALMADSEDSYMRLPTGLILRFVRYVGVLLSILLPGYFLALALYHQGLLSTEILSTVVASRRMVFEPIIWELLMLLLVFQLVREAGMRVPGALGQAIGIIGGLILGQAAVAANLASSVILIVVALSGLGNFCVPDYSMQISMEYYRVILIIAAWLGGLFGITCAIMLFVAHLVSMKSYGVPFLSPYTPRASRNRPFFMRGKIRMHARASDYINAVEDKRL